MKYLIRDGKIEFSGNKKDVIIYLKEAYQDEYAIEQYGKILDKDLDKLYYVVECLGMNLLDRKPNDSRKKSKQKRNR